jgi:glycosidase
MSEEEALEKVNFGSRDNARHPMCWDDSDGAGFTTGTPWFSLHPRYREINVKGDRKANKSVWRFYQALLSLRRNNETFLDGDFDVISSVDDPYFIYTRAWKDEKWVIVCNFETEQEISVPFNCEAPALTNLKRTSMSGVYAPYECAIARVSD